MQPRFLFSLARLVLGFMKRAERADIFINTTEPMNEDLMDVQTHLPVPPGRPFFPKMIAISLAVHLLCTLVLIGGGSGRQGTPTINYLDLTMSQLQSVQTPSNPARQTLETPPLLQEGELPEEQQPAAPPSETEQLKQNLQNAVNSAADQPEAMQKFSFGLGLVNGHFGTIADGKTLRDDMREYYLSMLRTINEKWWVDGSRYEGVGGAIINITVARNGEILRANMLQSSGNPAYDRALIKSLEGASPVPPLPPNFIGNFFMAPIRFNPPLKLLSLK